MLDDFKNEQPIVYKVLTNSLKKNKYSHAYLFELNGYPKGLDMALALAKFLLCPNGYTNNEYCNNCSQCHNIDSNNFLEIKIIEADGQWIKKEQLEELQRQFMTKSLIGNKKIYIIKEAERLNVSAANSLLKFLEEPPEGIVAILLTNNMYQLLNTIISRCQILTFKKYILSSEMGSSIERIGKYLYSDEESYNNFITEEGLVFIDKIIEYVTFLEKHKQRTIIYKNKAFIELFNDRKKINIAFNLLILYYKDILNKILGLNCEYYIDFEDSMADIVDTNDLNSISSKIKILVDLSVNIKFNLNANLLMDKLVIMLSEV